VDQVSENTQQSELDSSDKKSDLVSKARLLKIKMYQIQNVLRHKQNQMVIVGSRYTWVIVVT